MSKYHFFFCVVLNIYVIDSASTRSRNELCTTASNEPGRCIVISQCQPIDDLMKAKPITKEILNYLKSSHCGYNKSEPKVCCSLDDKSNATHSPGNGKKAGIALPSLDVCGKFREESVIGSYPWAALLEYQRPNGTGFHCGGVLISNRYVLTAAHCVLGTPTDWNLFSVRLGEYDMAKDPDCVNLDEYTDCADPVVDVNIEKITVHENYNSEDADRHYDIALLKLTKPISFTDFIAPICLPPENYQGRTTMFRTAGWGANQHSTAKDVKQASTLPANVNAECRNGQKSDANDQLCIAQSRRYHNICYVDSGGALIATMPQYAQSGNYFAIGVSSMVLSFCGAEKPLSFIKVSNYVPWIVQNMQS